jgi:hypothetical protein
VLKIGAATECCGGCRDFYDDWNNELVEGGECRCAESERTKGFVFTPGGKTTVLEVNGGML